MYLLSASFHPSHNRLQCILTLLSLNDIFSCLLPRKIIISFNIFYDCVVKLITCFPRKPYCSSMDIAKIFYVNRAAF